MAGKIVLKVFLVIVILIMVFALGMLIAAKTLWKAHHGDEMEVLKADVENPPKALVVYQKSLTSAAGDVAHWIAGGLHDGGYEVTLNHPGEHLSSDISDYAIVVLGGPNYGSRIPEALPEYADRVGDFAGKRVILFSTSGGIDTRPELDQLEERIHGVEVYASIKFKFNETEANEKKAYQLGQEAAGEE